MNLSVILPILNEASGIEESITSILTHGRLITKKIEIIAVDDGSTDRTEEILQKLAKRNRGLKIIKHKTNKGYGAALRSGLKNASHEWVFFTDADMQFNFEEIKKFLRYTKDYDFIVGFRKNRADRFNRKITSFVYNRLIKTMFGLKLRDVDCAFKLMNKNKASEIKFKSNSFFVSAELMITAFKRGYRIKEIGVEHLPRTSGKSKVTIQKVLLTISDLLKLYRTVKYTINRYPLIS